MSIALNIEFLSAVKVFRSTNETVLSLKPDYEREPVTQLLAESPNIDGLLSASSLNRSVEFSR